MEHTKVRPVDDGVSTAMSFVSASHSKGRLRHRELQHYSGGKAQTPPDMNNVRGLSHTSTEKQTLHYYKVFTQQEGTEGT